jgi:hypothetical protein
VRSLRSDRLDLATRLTGRGADGVARRAAVAQLTVDRLAKLWAAVTADLPCAEGIALGAVGSLGRAEASPASDLDLLLVHDGRTHRPALVAEVADARAALDRPAARRLRADNHEQALRIDEVEALLASGALVVDACRRGLHAGGAGQSLARRPLLFALARALAEKWPGDVDRNDLIARAFRTRRPDETHRARLRVEIGRLRALISPLARIEASARGFALTARGEREVVVLVPPIEGDQASLLALLADGAAWSTSALALAVGSSQRTVQRALVELEAAGRVRSIGRTRARRWLSSPLVGFTTILLLPAALSPA